MGDVIVDVILPNAITTDVTSPSYPANANVYIPGSDGPPGPQGPAGNNDLFKIINVSGQADLIPTGIETLRFIAGTGISIITSTDENPYKSIKIDASPLSANLFTTGSILNTKINNLSGYVNSQDNILSGQVASTGSILDTKINSLSGLFATYTGSLDATFATDSQLFTTGSVLDNKINSLSGYVNSQDIVFSGQTALTGSILDNKINSLSGLFTTYTGNLDANFASDIQLFNTGSILNNKINSLSGVSVLTFGNQNISGNKTFLNNINVSGSGIFNALDLNNIDTLNLSGVDISITNGNVNLTNRPTINSSGVALIGELINTGSLLDNKINSLSGYVNSQNIIFSGQISSSGSNLYKSILLLSGLFTGYTGSLDATFATDAQLFTTGSILDTKINSLSGHLNSQNVIFSGQIASTGSILDNKINSLSGYVNSRDSLFSDQTATTGSRLDNKINSLSGYVNSQDIIFSGQTFNTGSRLDNKINALSGYINSQNIIFSGQTASTGSILNNKINNLSGYINSSNSNIVFTTGNQSIAGNKTLTSKLNITVSASNDSALKVGTLEFQPYAVNNAWFGDNTYYNAGFYRREAGYAGAFYFAGPEGQFRFADTNDAGTSYSPAVQLKTHLDGRFGVGSDISTEPDNFTNSNFFVDSTDNGSNVGLGTINPAEKLHVAGNLKLDGSYIYIYDSTYDANNSIIWDQNELIFTNNYDYNINYSMVGFLFNFGPLGENVLYSNKPGNALATQLIIPSGKTDYIALASEVVNMTGNQIISGVKTFASRPTVNGTGVLLSGEGIASLITIQDEGSSQGSASTLNFIGGGVSVSVGGSTAAITINGGGGTSLISPPPTPNSAGTSGQMALDQNYSYFCISDNNWRRSAIGSW